jgi:hypothetical protein
VRGKALKDEKDFGDGTRTLEGEEKRKEVSSQSEDTIQSEKPAEPEMDFGSNDELSEIDIRIDFQITAESASNDGNEVFYDSPETPIPLIGTLESLEQTV